MFCTLFDKRLICLPRLLTAVDSALYGLAPVVWIHIRVFETELLFLTLGMHTQQDADPCEHRCKSVHI